MSNSAAGQIGGAEQDAVKGLLILLIILGHNSILTNHIPTLFPTLYSFHVFAFFFLPFLRKASPFSLQTFSVGASRYLIPYLWFVLISGLLFWLIFRRADPINIVSADFISAIFIGSANLLDKATGFQLFWFLPAFFSLYCLRSWAESQGKFGATTAILLAVFIHITAGALPSFVKDHTPLGLLIALYIYPLAIIASELWKRSAEYRGTPIAGLTLLLTVGLMATAQEFGSSVNLAILQVYAISDIGLALLHDAIPISAFLFVLSISRLLSHSSVLVHIGNNSLAIFLLHSLVFQMLLMMSRKLGITVEDGWGGILIGVLLLVFTVGISFALAVILRSTGIHSILFPKGGQHPRKIPHKANA